MKGLLTEFKVFEGEKFKGVADFTEMYPGHFEVLADKYQQRGMRIERVSSKSKEANVIYVLTITKFTDKNHKQIVGKSNMYFSTLEKAQAFIKNNCNYDNISTSIEMEIWS